MKSSNIIDYAQEFGYLKLDHNKLFITDKGLAELNNAVNDLYKFELIVNTELKDDQETFLKFYESFSQDGLYRILLDHLESKRQNSDFELMLNGMLSFL